MYRVFLDNMTATVAFHIFTLSNLGFNLIYHLTRKRGNVECCKLVSNDKNVNISVINYILSYENNLAKFGTSPLKQNHALAS